MLDALLLLVLVVWLSNPKTMHRPSSFLHAIAMTFTSTGQFSVMRGNHLHRISTNMQMVSSLPPATSTAVSYTHLTLPTIYSV